MQLDGRRLESADHLRESRQVESADHLRESKQGRPNPSRPGLGVGCRLCKEITTQALGNAPFSYSINCSNKAYLGNV